MNLLTLRSASTDDADAVQALSRQANQHHFDLDPKIFADPATLREPAGAHTASTDDTHCCYVAEVDGEVVAYLCAEVAVENREIF